MEKRMIFDGSLKEYAKPNEGNNYYLDNFLETLDKIGLGDKVVEVKGTLTLWDGKHEVHPRTFKTFAEAIRVMLTDSIEFMIYHQGNEFIVETKHCDGRNEFQVRFFGNDENKYGTLFLIDLEKIFKKIHSGEL